MFGFARVKNRILVNKDTFAYTVYQSNGVSRTNAELSRQNAGRYLDDSVKKHKTSSRVFVLGSGPSINDLETSDFAEIAKHDSIGFNFWPIHSFVPTFYLHQFPRQPYRQSLSNILCDKANEYANSVILLRPYRNYNDPVSLSKEVRQIFQHNLIYLVNELPIHSRCEVDPTELLEFFEKMDMMTFGKISRFTIKWRVTLGLLVSFCYQMGYKEIVLCGIDMNDSSHFFDNPCYNDLRNKYNLPRPGRSNIWTMMNPSYSKNTVERYVVSLRDFAWERSGVKIYVASKKSRLYPNIDACTTFE